MKVFSQCAICTHLVRPGTGHGLTCAAFPDGIPDDLYYNRHEHQQPYPGDNGIRWQPKSREAAETWKRLGEERDA